MQLTVAKWSVTGSIPVWDPAFTKAFRELAPSGLNKMDRDIGWRRACIKSISDPMSLEQPSVLGLPRLASPLGALPGQLVRGGFRPPIHGSHWTSRIAPDIHPGT